MSKNTNTIVMQSISMPIMHTLTSYYNCCYYSNGGGKADDTFQHSLLEQEHELQVMGVFAKGENTTNQHELPRFGIRI